MDDIEEGRLEDTFGDLTRGTQFIPFPEADSEFETVFIKIDEVWRGKCTGMPRNAVKLRNGSLVFFRDDTKVLRLA